MHWKLLTLLTVLLLLLAACAGPAQTVDSEQPASQAAPRASTDETATETTTFPVVSVYKSPTCGCCGDWIEHMEEAGFVVEAHDINDLVTVKQEHGVPGGLQSCHTALVDGYVIEGHVPAQDVSQLLAERPNVTGLAVPGMPIGSPGMEIAGQPAQPFDVVSFDADGNTAVFASHNK